MSWSLGVLYNEGEASEGLTSASEFIFIKIWQGKVIDDEGSRSSAGTLATLTASAGKDLYLLSAKINIHSTNTVAGESDVKVELQANSVVKETAHLTYSTGTTSVANMPASYEFIMKTKVAATQVIRLEAITVDADVEVEGTIIGFQEDTGVSPAI